MRIWLLPSSTSHSPTGLLRDALAFAAGATAANLASGAAAGGEAGVAPGTASSFGSTADSLGSAAAVRSALCGSSDEAVAGAETEAAGLCFDVAAGRDGWCSPSSPSSPSLSSPDMNDFKFGTCPSNIFDSILDEMPGSLNPWLWPCEPRSDHDTEAHMVSRQLSLIRTRATPPLIGISKLEPA